jgi:hypothetical protein
MVFSSFLFTSLMIFIDAGLQKQPQILAMLMY